MIVPVFGVLRIVCFPAAHSDLKILPTSGDSHYLGTTAGAREVDFDYGCAVVRQRFIRRTCPRAASSSLRRR